MKRAVTAVTLALVAVSAGIVLGVGRRAPAIVPLPSGAVTSSDHLDVVRVHVAGWVVSPGVVSLAPGSLVADAVEAAGGVRPGAAMEEVNLAAEVTDGQQVTIPGPGQQEHGADASGADGVVDINQASESELEELPGVGPVLAARIVSFREANGPFEVVEDLLEVPGIGEAKLQSMRDLVRP